MTDMMTRPVMDGPVRGARRARWMALALLAPPLALSLAGCGALRGDGGPKTPTVGNRVSILSNDASVRVDPTVAGQDVIIPAPVRNADWSQSGGNAGKVMGNLALAAERNQVWTANVAGGNNRQRLAEPPVVAGGRLFAIGVDAQVSAFNADTGALLWRRGVGSTRADLRGVLFGGGVAVDGAVVYATSGAGDVAALNAADGTVLWNVRPAGPLRGAPTLAFGAVYVVTQDNQLFALNAANGAVQWQAAAAVERGSVFGAGSPAAAQGTIVAGFSSGEIQAFRYENGRNLWEDALARTSMALSVATLTDVDADPVIDAGRVFALGQGGRMASYDLLTGQRIWEISIAGISTPLVAGQWVYVVTDDGKLLCVARGTGRVRWIEQLDQYRVEKKKKDPVRWTGPIMAGGRLILVNSLGQMVEIAPQTGQRIANHNLSSGTSLGPVVANEMLYVMTDDGRITAWR